MGLLRMKVGDGFAAGTFFSSIRNPSVPPYFVNVSWLCQVVHIRSEAKKLRRKKLFSVF